MLTNATGRAVLVRAAERLGGLEALARRLGISVRILRLCVNGHQPIPEIIYLGAVDIVLDELSEGDVRRAVDP